MEENESIEEENSEPEIIYPDPQDSREMATYEKIIKLGRQLDRKKQSQ